MGHWIDFRKWNGVPNASGSGCDYVCGQWRVELVDAPNYMWAVRMPTGRLRRDTHGSARAAIQVANCLMADEAN